MKKFIAASIVGALLVSCGESTETVNTDEVQITEESMLARLDSLEQGLSEMKLNKKTAVEVNSKRIELVETLKELYAKFPNSKEAPVALDKIHMTYSGMGKNDLSVAWADTLIMKYPDYENRVMVIESQAASYDNLMEPRDTAKVRYYYELLLKEDKAMDVEKREGIKQRLKYNHLSMEDYIDQKMKSIDL